MVSERSMDNFNIDDSELEDDGLVFSHSDHGFSDDRRDMVDDNEDLDFLSANNGRYSQLFSQDDLHTKWNRFRRKLAQSWGSQNSKKLLVGVSTMALLIVFFSVMLYSGSGNDAKMPGGAIHDDHPTIQDPGDSKTSAKLSLDDMRQGKYWVFDYDLTFVDYEPQHEGGRDDDSEVSKFKRELENNDGDHYNNSDEGYYLHQASSVISLHKASDPNFFESIIDLSKLQYNGTQIISTMVSVDKSLHKVIVASNIKHEWRASTTSIYWLVDTMTLEMEPIHYKQEKIGESLVITPLFLSYAAFSPNKKFIYFNYENNLYLKDITGGNITQITTDGDKNDIRNGKPDWVYEEEVLGEDRAIYWSPDDQSVAFIKFDDTKVPVYNLEMFSNDAYPAINELKYPKVGFSNPIVKLCVYQTSSDKLIEIEQPDNSLGDDFIIYQTVWITNEDLLFKRTDRTSRKIQICVYNVKRGQSEIIRSYNTDDYSGWYRNNGKIFVLPDNRGYIDTTVYNDHDHLTYFDAATDEKGLQLTAGDWDVIGGVAGYDQAGDVIYFIGTSGNFLQRQVYKVSLKDQILTPLTPLEEINSYSIKVSKKGKYGLMKYNGPELPSDKLVEMEKLADDSEYYRNLPRLDNAEEVASLLDDYDIPMKTYIPITTDDNVTINVVEVKPSNFDDSKKYPVLVSVYGGPGMQKTNCNFNYGFEEIVSSSMDAIVLYIDPRGTGGSGWDYRSWARNNIGYYEPRDITEATQKYISKRIEYVNTEKVAIWGWSYGGFTTLKTLEFDEGNTFRYGMAVAPVTNWLLYDSIYTERYMGKPEEHDYTEASIQNVESFKKVDRFLIMHGTGDDNVHYQHSLQLLNEFDLHNVENYDVHFFPDSDHSISHDNANVIVYDKLFHWLGTAFDL